MPTPTKVTLDAVNEIDQPQEEQVKAPENTLAFAPDVITGAYKGYNPAKCFLENLYMPSNRRMHNKAKETLDESELFYKHLEVYSKLLNRVTEKLDSKDENFDFENDAEIREGLDYAAKNGLIEPGKHTFSRRELERFSHYTLKAQCQQLPQRANAKISQLQTLTNDMVQISRTMSKILDIQDRFISNINRRMMGG